jgi:nucleoside-diphosphate-sugar epimerase
VYPGWPAEPVSEETPVWTEGDDYGPNKAASEREAEAALPGRVAALRAGLLCGPHDNVFRLPWWVQRIARGGDVLAPGDPDRHVQLIDARDLARWIVDLGERREAGVYNATSPPGRTTMREVLEATVGATGSDASSRGCPTRRSSPRRRARGSRCRCGCRRPRDLGRGGSPPLGRRRRGLRCRPIAETVADVWAWLEAGGAEAEGPDWLSPHAATGMSPERERELLAATAAR